MGFHIRSRPLRFLQGENIHRLITLIGEGGKGLCTSVHTVLSRSNYGLYWRRCFSGRLVVSTTSPRPTQSLAHTDIESRPAHWYGALDFSMLNNSFNRAMLHPGEVPSRPNSSAAAAEEPQLRILHFTQLPDCMGHGTGRVRQWFKKR